MRHRIRTLRREDGQAVVELALAIPLLLLVLFAIIQFGQGIAYYNDETNLANLAARYASVGKSATCGTSTDVSGYVQCAGAQESSALSGATTCLADSSITSGSGTTSTVPSGDALKVKVSVNFNLGANLPILSNFLGSLATIPISSSATMRTETTLTTGSGSWTPTVNVGSSACS